MKTTLEKLRNDNAGYAFGQAGITESDLTKVNRIIDRIELSRTEMPQVLDDVEYTDEFGCYYPNAIIDGDTYCDGSMVICENGCAYVSLGEQDAICKSISGGTFPRIDKDKLRYIGKKEKTFWTFSTMGAGAHQGLYFNAEVSCFELNNRSEEFKQYTTKNYDYVFVQDWREQRSECDYKYTVEKGCYSFCAFHTAEELKEFLSLYEAIEEPYFGNENWRKKYWILKSGFVSVWTQEEFDKIESDRLERCLFNGRKVPTKYIKDGTTLVKYVLRSDEIKIWRYENG